MSKKTMGLEYFMTEFTDFLGRFIVKKFFKTTAKKTTCNYFKKALAEILKHEGGYVNHPLDPGGATNKGITQRTYNNWLKSKNLNAKDVKDIKDDEIEEIYYQNYWLKSGADKIENPKLALIVFDTAVLHGVSKAIKYFELSCDNITRYLDLRQNHYDTIIKKHPKRKVFHKGWTNRNNHLREIEF